MAKTIIAGVTGRTLFSQAADIAAAAAITAAADALSLEKSAVDYRARPHGGERCDVCAFYRAETDGAPQGHCSMVLGCVAADAWCAIWSPAA